MRKFLLCLVAVFLALSGVTAQAQMTRGEGKLTADCTYWVAAGQPWVPLNGVSIDVTATFNANFNTLSVMGINLPDITTYTGTLDLKLDPQTGEVKGEDKLAYTYAAGYPAYFANYTDNEKTAPHVITGKLENTGANESTLTLSKWGDLLCENNGATNMYFNEATWDNTKVVFNFAIPALPAYVEPTPEPASNGTASFVYATWDDGDVPVPAQAVYGSYDNKVLTISNLIPDVIRSNTNPLSLTLNPETGELEGLDQLAYSFEDRSYGDLNVYYANNVPAAQRSKKINGTVENIEGGKCKVTLNDWCELSYYVTGPLLGIIADGTFKNTEITFDFAIPDLVGEDTPAIPAPATLNAYTATSAVIAGGMMTSSSLKQTVPMTDEGNGVFKGTFELSAANGYYFCFAMPGNYGSYTVYGSATKNPGGNALTVDGTLTVDLGYQDIDSKNCWYWGPAWDPEGGATMTGAASNDVGPVSLTATVDFNTGQVTFVQNIAEPAIPAPASLNVYTATSAVIAGGMMTSSSLKQTLPMTNDGNGVYTGTFELSAANGYYFCFGLPGNFGAYTVYGSATKNPGGNALTVDGTLTVDLGYQDIDSKNCWYWGPAWDPEGGATMTGAASNDVGTITLMATVDFNTGKVTFVNNSTPDASSAVTFNFTGATDAYKLVTVMDMQTSDDITVTSAKYTYRYEGMSGVMFGLNQQLAEQGYSLTVTGPNGDQPEDGSYAIAGTAMGGSGYMLSLSDGANGLEFTITVTAPAPTEYSVNINFTGDNFVLSNVNDCIDIMDLQAAEVVTVEGYSYIYKYTHIPSGLSFAAKEGYEISIESSDPELAGTAYTIEKMNAMDDEVIEYDSQYNLSLWPAADELTFTVTIHSIAGSEVSNVLRVQVVNGGSSAYRNAFTPSDDDVILTYNEATGTYVGAVTLNLSSEMQTTNIDWIKIYGGENGSYTYYGPNTNGYASGNQLKFDTEGKSITESFISATETGSTYAGGWRITQLPSGNQATINISVNLTDMSATFTLPGNVDTPPTGPAELRANVTFGNRVAYRESFTPSDDDVVLSWDSATGTYVGVVTMNLSSEMQTTNIDWLRFYSNEDGVYTYYGPNTDGYAAANPLVFNAEGESVTDPFISATEFGGDKSGGWRLTKLPEGAVSPAEISVSVNLNNMEATFTYGESQGEVEDTNHLYIAIGTGTGNAVPTVADKYLELGDDGIYTGNVNIPNQRKFFFYTKKDGVITQYLNGGESAMIRFGEDQPYNTLTLEEGTPNMLNQWMVYGNGFGVYDYDFTVDLENLTATMSVGAEKAPAALYIWGSTAGSTGRMSQWGDALLPTEEGSHIYTVEFNVPECNFDLVTDDPDGMNSDPAGLTHGFFFEFYDNKNTTTGGARRYSAPSDDATRQYSIPTQGSTYDSSLITGIAFNEGDDHGKYFIQLTPGLTKFTIDWDELTFTAEMLKPLTSSNSVTINFPNGYQNLTILDVTDGEAVNVDKTPFTYEYEQSGMLLFSPAEGYEVEITCDTPSDGLNYLIQNNPADEIEGTPAVSYLTLTYLCNGYTFNVNVTPANSVTFNFTGVEQAYTKVGLIEITSSGMDMIDLTGNSYEYGYANQGNIVVVPQEGYEVEITSTGSDANWTVTDYDFGIGGMDDDATTVVPKLVTFNAAANGYAFTVKVTEVASNSVTLNFVSVDDAIANPWQYVSMFDASVYETVDITGSSVTFDYSDNGNLVIGPTEEGYFITITCDGDDSNWNVQTWDSGIGGLDLAPSEDSLQLTFNAAANGYTFTVTVLTSAQVGVRSIQGVDTANGVVVYNLQGVCIAKSDDASAIQTLEPGMYIVNGKKVLIRK